MTSDTLSITLHVNGVPCTLPAPTIAAALDVLAMSPDARHIAVAVNDRVIPRTQWSDVTLGADDHVEIITAVAGG